MANKDLLPPDDGLLLPPDEPVAGPHDDVFDRMSETVAAGARTLGAKASELTATQGPVLKEHAQKLGAKMLDAAAQARDRAEEAARDVSVVLKDPSLRSGFWQTYKRRILLGAGAVVLLAGGGYGFGCHQATRMARDAVDAYVIRNHLQQQVTYQDISATPFGRVHLSGVKLSNPSLDIASLSISGLKPDGGMPDRLEVSWSGLALPATGILSGDDLAAFVGSGFQKLQGEGSFRWLVDSSSQQVEIKTAGSFANAGDWDFDVAFANVSLAVLEKIASGRGGQADPLSSLAALYSIELKSLSGSLDMSGLAKRAGEIPRTNMPAEGDRPLFDLAPAQLGTSLIEAGMSPSDARDTADALQKFARTGTRITLKSRIEQPVPLFTTGNFLLPQLMSLPAFVAATKLSLST